MNISLIMIASYWGDDDDDDGHIIKHNNAMKISLIMIASYKGDDRTRCDENINIIDDDRIV